MDNINRNLAAALKLNPWSAEFLKIYQLLQLETLMVGHGGSSAGSYLADPTSPIPSHCA